MSRDCTVDRRKSMMGEAELAGRSQEKVSRACATPKSHSSILGARSIPFGPLAADLRRFFHLALSCGPVVWIQSCLFFFFKTKTLVLYAALVFFIHALKAL
jgi:hypothetical protein